MQGPPQLLPQEPQQSTGRRRCVRMSRCLPATPDRTDRVPAPVQPAGAAAGAAAPPAKATAAAAHAASTRQQSAVSQQGQQHGSKGDSTASLQRRAASFVRRVVHSPMMQSALLWLEVSGTHPPADTADPAVSAAAEGLEWTLAQLLAMHLRTGDVQATGGSLLAALWVLESSDNSERSAASACLASWTRYLAAFSRELVLTLTADWAASFRQLRQNLVDAQARMLQQLGWRVRLDVERDVGPCHQLLFGTSTFPASWQASRPGAQRLQQQLDGEKGPAQGQEGQGEQQWQRPARPGTPDCEEPPRQPQLAPVGAPAATTAAPAAAAWLAHARVPRLCEICGEDFQAAAGEMMRGLCADIRAQALLIRHQQAGQQPVSGSRQADAALSSAELQQPASGGGEQLGGLPKRRRVEGSL